jgi:hypothetical protein
VEVDEIRVTNVVIVCKRVTKVEQCLRRCGDEVTEWRDVSVDVVVGKSVTLERRSEFIQTRPGEITLRGRKATASHR